MMTIAVIDGMAKLWSIDRDKDKSVRTSKDLAEVFTKKMVSKYLSYDKIHFIFVKYKVNFII